METILLDNLSNLGAVGLLIASLFIGIRYIVRMFKEQQAENKAIANEYIQFVKDSNKDLIEIVDKNTDAFNTMTGAYQTLIKLIESGR